MRLHAIARAVTLGVGAIFQPKTRPDDHWSATPEVHVVVEGEVAGSAADAGARRRA